MGIINAECGKTVTIGYQGENKRQRIRIDLSDIMADIPGGTAVLAIRRNGDDTIVPALNTEIDGTSLLWLPTAWELANSGFLYAQVTYSDGDAIGKTKKYRFDVKDSMIVSGVEPEDWEDLVGELVQAAADVNAAIESYDEMTAEATALPAGSTPTAEIDRTGDHPVLKLGLVSGSGGTTDYDDLENRPQIAGVTLTGDVSLHDLGAAAESDIPDVSGFYTKPSGGIPDTDLASGVQTSLGKADTAYQLPSGGIPADDIASGVIPDPTSIIDDTAGSGDTNKVWSADKSHELLTEITNAQEDITDVKSAIDYVAENVFTDTDNLVDTEIKFSKWTQGWPGHTNYTYGVYYDEYIPVTGGDKYYGNFGVVDPSVVGSNFRFRIFQYDSSKNAIAVDWGASSVVPDKVNGIAASVTLNASTAFILVVLSTDSNSYPITPNTIKNLPVYFGKTNVARNDIYPTVLPVTTVLDKKYEKEVERIDLADSFTQKVIDSDNGLIDSFIGTRKLENITIPASATTIRIASFPMKAGNYVIDIKLKQAVNADIYFTFVDEEGETVFNSVGILTGNTTANAIREVDADTLVFLCAKPNVEVTVESFGMETYEKGGNSFAKVSSLIETADRVGYIGVTDISVPKGTIDGLLFRMNLKKRKEYVFHAKFKSALSSAIYFHINTSGGTLISSIGMASGLTERTVTYVPDDDYASAQITVTAQNSSQTLEIAEMKFDGTISENAISEVDSIGENEENIYTDAKHLRVYNPYKNAGSNQYKGQMHCHTIGGENYDEPLCTAQECVDAHAEAGYDFITITDYARTNVVTGKPSNMRGMVWLCNALEEVIGANVSAGTPTTHAITYFVSERTLPEMDNVQTAMTTFKEQGKIPSLAHPMWTGTPWTYEEVETLLKDIPFVEVWNGLAHWHEEQGDDWITDAYVNYTDFAFDALLSNGVHTFCTAVSDLHSIIPAIVDDGYVMVMAEEKTREAIWNALLSGAFYASSGATITGISLTGNVFTVTTETASKIEFIGKNGAILSTLNNASSGSYTIIGTEGYVRCRVTDGNGKKAWTQAIVIK